MTKQEQGPGVFGSAEENENKGSLHEEISKRMEEGVSDKVKQRVKETFIPNINNLGDYAEKWLNGLENDFYVLVEDPNDESGGGYYEGWSSEEIKELYYVLYGEKIDE